MIADGVAPEQARMILPQGTETSWVETASLYAYARLCNERMQSDAQVEIRDLSEKIHEQAKDIAPVCWKELTDG
jgi:thymidylate synthase (FAD)